MPKKLLHSQDGPNLQFSGPQVFTRQLVAIFALSSSSNKHCWSNITPSWSESPYSYLKEKLKHRNDNFLSKLIYDWNWVDYDLSWDGVLVQYVQIHRKHKTTKAIQNLQKKTKNKNKFWNHFSQFQCWCSYCICLSTAVLFQWNSPNRNRLTRLKLVLVWLPLEVFCAIRNLFRYSQHLTQLQMFSQ